MPTYIAKLSFFVAFSVLGSTTFARELRPADFDYCKTQEDLARRIMEARQAGTSMSAIMDTVRTKPGISESAVKTVQRAYDARRYFSPEIQQRTTADFANDHYAACLKARSEDLPF